MTESSEHHRHRRVRCKTKYKSEQLEVDWSDPRFSTREPSFAELYEAMGREGCPLCFLSDRVSRRYIHVYCGDNVTDVDIRSRIRESNGFCNTHAHQLVSAQFNPLAVAFTYSDILRKIRRELQKTNPSNWKSFIPRTIRLFSRKWLRNSGNNVVFSHTKSCPVCTEINNAETRYVSTLITHWQESLLQERFKSRSALCLPHLKMAIDAAVDPDLIALLLNVQIDYWDQLDSHLEEVIRKADYRFSKERLSDDERQALLDVIDVLSGVKGLR